MKIQLHMIILLIFTSITLLGGTRSMALPKGFVYLEDIDPSIVQEMRYFTSQNFVGRPIKGYAAPKCILTQKAALALLHVQQQLKSKNLGLKVFDCYRPQQAVDDFIAWSGDASDQKMKLQYYPNVNKKDFFKLGYVAAKSSHTRGSTVDLTLIHLSASSKQKDRELDMGTHFDFMDELSHPFSPRIQDEALKNRLLLRGLMQQAGFLPLETEWWHFTLKDEAFPDVYFNFPVK